MTDPTPEQLRELARVVKAAIPLVIWSEKYPRGHGPALKKAAAFLRAEADRREKEGK